MKIKMVVHEAEDGGFWAEVPSIHGCVTQGDTLDELMHNIQEAVELCLSIDVRDFEITERDRIVGIAV
ncbi:MAG: type II toxin-antitoxin system HicB family antitoxin [bacterium]|nr:type II toxin-antitoxin system HicB family antitoxin [bacterium]